MGESRITLADLRANPRPIVVASRLFDDARFDGSELRVQRGALRAAVARLSLDAAAAATLSTDAELISGWYLTSARRAYWRTDAASDRAALLRVAKAASAFAKVEFTDIRAAQGLIDTVLHDRESGLDDVDLLALQHQLQVLVTAAGDLAKRASPGAGRTSARRRDRAVALIAAAVEEATGTPIEISRGTSLQPAAHFKNAAGAFIVEVMILLGWPDEHVLARAFEAQRRARSVK